MKNKAFGSIMLATIFVLSLGFNSAPPAEAQIGPFACYQACTDALAIDLQRCEQYLVPDGNGGWVQNPEYDSCVDLAHLTDSLCEFVCMIDMVF